MNGSFANLQDAEPAPEAAPVATPRRLSDLQKTITMAQIAKAAGVSQGAISSLLNDRDYGIRVSDKTRERVFRVCREMGYIPNDLRAVVRMYPEVGDFCVLIAEEDFVGGIGNPGVTRLLETVLREAAPYSMTVCPYRRSADYNDPQQLPAAITAGVASKFLFAGPGNPILAKAVIQKGLPVAWIGGDLPMEGVRCFLSDLHGACHQALQKLQAAGHQRVLLFPELDASPASSFLSTTAQHRLQHEILRQDPGFAEVFPCGSTLEAGLLAYESFAASHATPSAAVFLNDLAAAGFHLAASLNRPGTPVPVISLDGQSSGMHRTRGVSVLRAPVEKMVADAVRWVTTAVSSNRLHESGKEVYAHIWESAPDTDPNPGHDPES
jgi:DNA-binding LacI/PurR family transcriptional regulator